MPGERKEEMHNRMEGTERNGKKKKRVGRDGTGRGGTELRTGRANFNEEKSLNRSRVATRVSIKKMIAHKPALLKSN